LFRNLKKVAYAIVILESTQVPESTVKRIIHILTYKFKTGVENGRKKMPQATDELRETISIWFGSIDLLGPLNFLLKCGWEDKAGVLIAPASFMDTSLLEHECAEFLFQEWDYDVKYQTGPDAA
jgi:hypothetical protein